MIIYAGRISGTGSLCARDSGTSVTRFPNLPEKKRSRAMSNFARKETEGARFSNQIDTVLC